MAEAALQKGRVLAGRYELEEKLGEGGMGTIWRAHDRNLTRPVAVKLIDRDVTDDTLERFEREAKAAAKLRSPHVVQIIESGVDKHGDKKTPYIVMELLDGENLAQRLKRSKRMSAAETGRIMTQVGRAVGRAHEAGIIHRDLKLENIFLVRNEDEELVKVLDFGVAKLRDDPLVSKEAGSKALTRTGSLLGTPYYMSPEQAQGNKEIDHRSDLWALAVIAFECLTGKRPFSSDGLGDLVLQICVRDIPVPSDVAPVPIGFDAWFHRATQRDPDERFQSARELIDALRAALGLEERPTMGTVPEIVVSNDIAIQEGEARQSASSVATTPSQFGKSATRVSLTSQPDVDGSAPTIVARREDAGTLTVRQFGTSQAGAPVRAGLGKGLVFAVAAGALIIGLGAGFAVLNPSSVSMWSGKLYNRWLELWGRAPMAETDSSPMSESRRSSEPRPAGVAIGPGVSRSSSSVQGSASARAAAGVSVAGAQKAGVQPAKSAEAGRPAIQRGQILPDGGYARPDWARMDESPKEPPPPPKKEPPPPPPEPAASGVVKDNPY